MKVKSGKLNEDRRQFLKKMGGFAVMSTLGMAFFTSCSEDDDANPYSSGPTPTPTPGGGNAGNGITVSGNTITIDIGIQTDLAADGGWLLITEADLLVVNDNGFKALTSVCTHSGCNTNWALNNKIFVCSCHNSRFDTNGNVVNGPATSPLQSFTVTEADGILTIEK